MEFVNDDALIEWRKHAGQLGHEIHALARYPFMSDDKDSPGSERRGQFVLFYLNVEDGPCGWLEHVDLRRVTRFSKPSR